MKIGLIIFTKNELKNSKKTFFTIPRKVIDTIYVVDGNSTDGTKEFYEKNKIRVFQQKYSRWGGAYESAFRNTKEDALIFWHPDGNMDASEIKVFVKLLKEGADFVVATRMIKGAYNEEDNKFLKPRKWFNQVFALLVHVMWGMGLPYATDMSQGYRAITRKAYKKMNIRIPSAIAPDLEQIIRALKNKIIVTEFPTREGYRISGNTNLPSLTAGTESIKVFLKELFSS